MIVVGVIVFLLVLAALFGTDGDGTSSTAETAVSTAPRVDVTAKELFRAYSANEAAAQQQYGDQPLRVTGTVAGINLDLLNKPVILLETDNQFMSAQASLKEASQPRASGLVKGQDIVLLCDSVGEVIGTPMLRDCDLAN